MKKFADFLEQDFVVELRDDVVCEDIQASTSTVVATKRCGPRVSYVDSSKRTKKRRSYELAAMYSREELIEAAERKNESYEESSDSEMTTIYSADEKKLSDILATTLRLKFNSKNVREYEISQ